MIKIGKLRKLKKNKTKYGQKDGKQCQKVVKKFVKKWSKVGKK
jgi:hypothetical protein